MKKRINVLLCVLLACTLWGCKAQQPKQPEVQEEENHESVETQNLESVYDPDHIYGADEINPAVQSYSSFALKQLYACVNKGENDFVSSLSLYYVLAMLSNGAAGETRKELQTVLGLSTTDLNNFLKKLDDAYEKNYSKANAIWVNQNAGVQLKQSYTDTIHAYYGDSIFEADFSKAGKLAKEINDWSVQHTDGSIDSIISEDQISNDQAFALLNALAMGEKWMFPFNSSDTYSQVFHAYDGSTKTTDMMHQTLDGYWHLKDATGFMKMLDNSAYFVAILPDEGIDIYDYVSRMDADTIKQFLLSRVTVENEEYSENNCYWDRHVTNLSFPKFSYETEYDLSEALKKMGLKNLFNADACDFSQMAEGDPKKVAALEVSDVTQKCSIEVNEERVVASAVTVLMLGLGAGGCQDREIITHDVVFDRPFLFALVSGEYMPFFLGIVSDLGEEIPTASMQIENIIGTINIRSLPSTKGEKHGYFEKGQIVVAYETKEAEGYTWYRIGTDRWVADQKGEWIQVIAGGE